MRIYRPEASGLLPAMVFFHGGGWVFGSVASHDALCRRYAHALRALVVSVDYRLAPEVRTGLACKAMLANLLIGQHWKILPLLA